MSNKGSANIVLSFLMRSNLLNCLPDDSWMANTLMRIVLHLCPYVLTIKIVLVYVGKT